MPRWPKGYKVKHPERDYPSETRYEQKKLQVKRRESRNKARDKAEARGLVHKGDQLELDHVGYHKRGTLARVPTRVVSRHANRIRQPPHK